jgi:hypothetical protein
MFPGILRLKGVYTNQPGVAPWWGCFAAIPDPAFHLPGRYRWHLASAAAASFTGSGAGVSRRLQIEVAG